MAKFSLDVGSSWQKKLLMTEQICLVEERNNVKILFNEEVKLQLPRFGIGLPKNNGLNFSSNIFVKP